MSRVLTLMMIVILVIAHGSSVAAAVCRHQSGVEHVAALESSDSAVSTQAFNEEAAGKVASKKGAPTDGGSVSWPSDMLPAPGLPVPLGLADPLEPDWAEVAILVGASLRPLLEPPSA